MRHAYADTYAYAHTYSYPYTNAYAYTYARDNPHRGRSLRDLRRFGHLVRNADIGRLGRERQNHQFHSKRQSCRKRSHQWQRRGNKYYPRHPLWCVI